MVLLSLRTSDRCHWYGNLLNISPNRGIATAFQASQ